MKILPDILDKSSTWFFL